MRYTEIDLQIEDVMWFGIDRNGFVISCTTAGIGNVPEFVCRSKEETEKLYDFFSAKLSDKADYSLNVKKEDNDLINEAIALAKKGVFCFDAVVDDNHYGEYRKISSPNTPLSYRTLPLEIQNIIGDHQIDIDVIQSNMLSIPHAY